jgi:hypothetical protein
LFTEKFDGGGLFAQWLSRFSAYLADSACDDGNAGCGEQKANIALEFSYVPRTEFGMARLRRCLQGLPRKHRGEHRDAARRLGYSAMSFLRGAAALSSARDFQGPHIAQIRGDPSASWGLT